jgi:uncharacterized membrane protein
LPGVNVLLEGPTGTGKTHSIGTLVDEGVKRGLSVYYLGLEAGMESLLGYWTDRGLEVPANLHWHSMQSADYGFAGMIKVATDINQMSNDMLAKLQDPNKAKHNQFIKLLQLLSDFEDQRTGQKFGAVDKWGTDRALVVDALTGINSAAMSMVVGSKPIKSLVDWGIAMDQIERIIKQLAEGCKCHFVLLSHIERETDQVLGGVKITVGTLGNKLAAKIPPMFSDVILTSRQNTNFYWSTANAQADLKARNLPIAEQIKPDFSQILDKWYSRGGRFSPLVKK